MLQPHLRAGAAQGTRPESESVQLSGSGLSDVSLVLLSWEGEPGSKRVRTGDGSQSHLPSMEVGGTEDIPFTIYQQ